MSYATYIFVSSIFTADVTDDDILHTDLEAQKNTVPFTFILSVFATIFVGTVLIIFVFICLRQLLPTGYSSAMYEPSSIPLSSYVMSTNESLHNSFESTVDQHENIEHTYFPSTDHTFYENTELKSEVPFKQTTNKCSKNLQEVLLPRSRSDPIDVYNSDARATGYRNTDTQQSEIHVPGYFADDTHFYQYKQHDTL